MSVSTAERSRIDLSTRTAVLLAGDLGAILLFVAIGESNHGYNPLVDVGRVAGTFAPFLIGWLLVAGIAGLYASDGAGSLARLLGITFGSWVGAVAVAQLLRATAYFHGDAALTFALVSTGVGGLFLLIWRAVAMLLIIDN